MLFEAWQQSSLTGCAPAALVAVWPSFALYGESTAPYWHACREAECGGCGVVLLAMCGLGGLGPKPMNATCDLHCLEQSLLD